MAKRDLSKLPVKLSVKNVGKEDVGFRYFRVNFVEVLKPEDEVVLKETEETAEEEKEGQKDVEILEEGEE